MALDVVIWQHYGSPTWRVTQGKSLTQLRSNVFFLQNEENCMFSQCWKAEWSIPLSQHRPTHTFFFLPSREAHFITGEWFTVCLWLCLRSGNVFPSPVVQGNQQPPWGRCQSHCTPLPRANHNPTLPVLSSQQFTAELAEGWELVSMPHPSSSPALDSKLGFWFKQFLEKDFKTRLSLFIPSPTSNNHYKVLLMPPTVYQSKSNTSKKRKTLKAGRNGNTQFWALMK